LGFAKKQERYRVSVSDRASAGPVISLPAATLLEIRRALVGESGASVAARALRNAGTATGDAIFWGISARSTSDPRELGDGEFWSEVGNYLASSGWGRVTHERVHPGLGVVRSPNWAESDPDGGEDRPTCWLGAGALSRIFTRIAGTRIDVVESSCRSRGDSVCTFVFGSAEAVEQVRALLRETGNLEEALLRL
jgi:hypothetical protein